MASTVEEISIRYEEDGQELVKELDKEVLSKGAWSTIMFLFQNYNKRLGTYDPPRVTIRRFQKTGGNYVLRSKFNISSAKQARKIIEILNKWYLNGQENQDQEAAAQAPQAQEAPAQESVQAPEAQPQATDATTT